MNDHERREALLAADLADLTTHIGMTYAWATEHGDTMETRLQVFRVWLDRVRAEAYEEGRNDLAAHDAEVARRAAVRALREAVADMRRAREGSWNLRDPRDPEVAYSVDVWLEVRANRLAETELEKIDAAEAEASRPATGYKVGDPDPTPNLDEPEGYCDEPSPSAAFCCTWGTGHPGLPHIAGDGIKILAVWPQNPPEPSRDERDARRRRFNVNAEAVERRKVEMTAAELKYRRATATPDHPLAEPDPKES